MCVNHTDYICLSAASRGDVMSHGNGSGIFSRSTHLWRPPRAQARTCTGRSGRHAVDSEHRHQWHMLPQCYPNFKQFIIGSSPDANVRYCERFVRRGEYLVEEGVFDERNRFIDAMFASAKGGGEGVVPIRQGKGVKILATVDRQNLPLSLSTYATNYHEVTLVQLSVDFYMLEAKPEHLIGDRAYDRDGLDDTLKHDGINMIAPHRSTSKLKNQDGRHLRRYQRGWLVERFFAWLQLKRRLLVRWEYYASNFLGFVQLASITMLLKRL